MMSAEIPGQVSLNELAAIQRTEIERLRGYEEAVIMLLNADHHDHFQARMSDSEMEAIQLMKSLVAWKEYRTI
jgi:hypothetical protein